MKYSETWSRSVKGEPERWKIANKHSSTRTKSLKKPLAMSTRPADGRTVECLDEYYSFVLRERRAELQNRSVTVSRTLKTVWKCVYDVCEFCDNKILRFFGSLSSFSSFLISCHTRDMRGQVSIRQVNNVNGNARTLTLYVGQSTLFALTCLPALLTGLSLSLV